VIVIDVLTYIRFVCKNVWSCIESQVSLSIDISCQLVMN
jgi:hypothetical protein